MKTTVVSKNFIEWNFEKFVKTLSNWCCELAIWLEDGPINWLVESATYSTSIWKGTLRTFKILKSF